MYNKFGSYEGIMKHKKENSQRFSEFIYAALGDLAKATNDLVNALPAKQNE